MAGVDHIPDEILRNILSRLPPKPMGRSRCVSTHWNRLISDPSFMMSRSSSRLFLSRDASDADNPMSIHILDGSNGSVTDLEFSMFKDLPTIKNWDDRFITIVGTFSGIILLAVKDYIKWEWEKGISYMEEHMILYNPFTGVYEIFKDPYSPLYGGAHAYGFGYGATPDELKLIRFRMFNDTEKCWDACEVLNLKTRSWTQPALISPDGHFQGYIGTFLKGYLYWMNSSKIMALNVDKMVISYIHQPDSTMDKQSYLGTCHGCLWMITNTDVKTLNFDVWVMSEQGVGNSWSKACSLAIGLEPPGYFPLSQNIKITEDGRIIIYINNINMDDYHDYRHMFIYDTSKHSYKLLKCPSEEEEAERGIKYKESLISPMNICRVSSMTEESYVDDCVSALNAIPSVSKCSYNKALNHFHDVTWRKIFMLMPEDRRKDWLDSLDN